MWKINGNKIKYLWVKQKFDCTLTKEPQSYISHFAFCVIMGLLCPKLNNSNLIKDRSNYIRLIYHLYRNNENNVTYVTLRDAYLFSKVYICDIKNSSLR